MKEVIYNTTNKSLTIEVVEREWLKAEKKPHPFRTRVVSYVIGPGEGLDPQHHKLAAKKLKEAIDGESNAEPAL